MRSRFGWGADRIIRGDVPWNLAVMLVGEICREPYSHCTAALQEWAFVPDPVDVLFLNWVDATAALNWQPGRVKPKPVKRPWLEKTTPHTVRFDPESDKRRARLRERLGM